MQYMGGKSRIARQIANVILESTENRTYYVEPFVGAGSVAAELVPHFNFSYLSDASPDLVALWRALQDGWEPPETVTEAEYQAQRNAPVSALRGFVGYGCSFSGKWFGGYARDPRKSWSFAQTAINSLDKKMQTLQPASFYNLDYRDLLIPRRAVVYCDPPYAGTTKYGRLSAFNNREFWEQAKRWAEYSEVFVSEYVAPEGWVSVWQGSPKMTLKRGDNTSTAIDQLWRFNGRNN